MSFLKKNRWFQMLVMMFLYLIYDVFTGMILIEKF